MTNKLLKNQKHALAKKPMAGQKNIPAKSQTSRTSPAPPSASDVLASRMTDRMVAGLPEDRYYKANDALDTIARATKHYQDKRLMGDVKKVAQHKINELSNVVGRGGKRGK